MDINLLPRIVADVEAAPCSVEPVGLVYNDDCLKVLGQLPSCSIDLIVTDPPYGVGWRDNRLPNDTPGAAIALFAAFARLASRLLIPGACVCSFCSSASSTVTTMQTWIDVLKSLFEYRQTLVWDKVSIGVGTGYRQTHEYILLASQKGARYRWFGSKSAASILRFARQNPTATTHPTPKPVRLLRELILNHSQEGDLVLDPFCGSGSTLLAAREIGRRYVGVEVDPLFASEAVYRLQSQF